jgi:hypothetical protein
VEDFVEKQFDDEHREKKNARYGKKRRRKLEERAEHNERRPQCEKREYPSAYRPVAFFGDVRSSRNQTREPQENNPSDNKRKVDMARDESRHQAFQRYISEKSEKRKCERVFGKGVKDDAEMTIFE